MPTDTVSARLDQVAKFAEAFRDVFPRADQFRWFSIYVWGLLAVRGRRSVAAIARSLSKDMVPPGTSPAQSLQHFLGHSNWDERRLLSKLRSHLPVIGEPGATWVIHEVVCLKRGKHSVGVYRQFSRDHGIKANSQTAVLISQVGPSGYWPLSLRLYLPRGWLDHAQPAQLAEIPDLDHQPQSKDTIGRNLLLELAAEGKSPAQGVIAANSFASSVDLGETIDELKWRLVTDIVEIERAEKGRDWLNEHLGLDHFEGRSWRGWHRHAASVLTAYAYLGCIDKQFKSI